MERLQKYIASCGIASRRKAEALITEGHVQVNGRKVTELGVKIDPQKDRVKVDGQLLAQEKPVYYLLNKPKGGVITSVSDPQGRETVLDYIKNESKRIYPVGRLDLYTEGLLLLTNDGELAQNLTHPSKGVEKTYEVRIKGRVRDEDLQIIANGVNLEDGMTAPATIIDLGFDDHNGGVHEVEITIHEGKNRQVRRMFEHFGYRIHNLKRIAYGGGLTLGGVKRGGSRELTSREVKALKALGSDKK
nr:pseudouridine synthase [Veillonella denticariosi]